MFSALLQATSRITSALLNTQRRSRPTWSWALIRCTPQSAAEEGSTASRTWSTPDSPQSGLTARGYFSSESESLSEGYTMDAFSISERPFEEEGRGRGCKESHRWWERSSGGEQRRSPTHLQRVWKDLRHFIPTWADTSRPTAALTARWHASVPTATRFTCPCQHWPCTSSLTTSSTNVTCAAKPSAGPGCFRGTCDRIQEKNPSPAPTAGKPSLTGPTYERTCRRIRPSNTTAASAAIRPSRWSPTWTSTTSPPASEAPETRTSLAPRINKREKMKMS